MLTNPIYFNSLEDKENALLALSDSYCRKILLCIVKNSKTVHDISKELSLSKSSVYRKLRWLEKSKLVNISGMISNDGHKIFQYQSRIQNTQSICFDDGLVVNIVLNGACSHGT